MICSATGTEEFTFPKFIKIMSATKEKIIRDFGFSFSMLFATKPLGVLGLNKIIIYRPLEKTADSTDFFKRNKFQYIQILL